MTRVLRKPASLRDLVAIGRYIATENPDAAERFRAAAQQTYELLAGHPRLGRERHFQRRPGLRSFRIPEFRDYVVFYRPIRDGVEIFRILHGVRDLRRLLTRRRMS